MPTWRNEWIYFLPNQVVVLEPYGVTRREFVYNAPIIAALIDTDGAAPSGKVRIFWDPNDLRQVYCFDVAGNAYEVPWVFRTQETPVFTDFRVDVALKRVDGSTVSKSQYRQRVADLVVGWRAEDEVVLVRVRGRRSEEEMLASQLDKIRAVDPGTVISADEFVGQAAVESMRARDDALDIDEDEGIRRLDNVEDDLFDEFDS